MHREPPLQKVVQPASWHSRPSRPPRQFNAPGLEIFVSSARAVFRSVALHVNLNEGQDKKLRWTPHMAMMRKIMAGQGSVLGQPLSESYW